MALARAHVQHRVVAEAGHLVGVAAPAPEHLDTPEALAGAREEARVDHQLFLGGHRAERSRAKQGLARPLVGAVALHRLVEGRQLRQAAHVAEEEVAAVGGDPAPVLDERAEIARAGEVHEHAVDQHQVELVVGVVRDRVRRRRLQLHVVPAASVRLRS